MKKGTEARIKSEYWKPIFKDRQYKDAVPMKLRAVRLSESTKWRQFLLLKRYWKMVADHPMVPMVSYTDSLDWKIANALYCYRYVTNGSPDSLKDRFGVSDQRLAQLVQKYTWYPTI